MKKIKAYGKTISFDEARHRFTNEKGESIPSVTSFTGVIDKSRPLIFWAVRLTKEYLLERIDNGEAITVIDIEEASRMHTKKKEEAADIGTRIHKWVERWIAGEKPELPDNEKERKGVTAFLKFQKEHNVKWLESEKIVYSKKYNFAGILDAVGTIGDKLTLIDFKSSNALYDEYRFQVSAYQLAYEEMTGKKIDERIIIRFGKEDGEFESVTLDEDDKDKKAFLGCIAVKRRLNELSKYGK